MPHRCRLRPFDDQRPNVGFISGDGLMGSMPGLRRPWCDISRDVMYSLPSRDPLSLWCTYLLYFTDRNTTIMEERSFLSLYTTPMSCSACACRVVHVHGILLISSCMKLIVICIYCNMFFLLLFLKVCHHF